MFPTQFCKYYGKNRWKVIFQRSKKCLRNVWFLRGLNGSFHILIKNRWVPFTNQMSWLMEWNSWNSISIYKLFFLLWASIGAPGNSHNSLYALSIIFNLLCSINRPLKNQMRKFYWDAVPKNCKKYFNYKRSWGCLVAEGGICLFKNST